MIESEKKLERKLSREVEKLGGWCIKLVCLHLTGLPDRLCLLPNGVLFFAEVKTTKQKPRKIQISVHKKLRKLGFQVYIIDTSESISKTLAKYK